MPELTLVSGLALFGAGLAAGTINVIAGGGSMLTLPVMIFLGLPPTVANGTNRIALLVQNVGAVGAFAKHDRIPKPWLKWCIPSAVVGAVLGTWAAVNIGEGAFQRILAFVLLGTVLMSLWSGVAGTAVLEDAPPPTTARGRALLVGAYFLIGMYGGFIQVGVGLIALVLLSMFGLDLVRGNALKVTVVLAWTVVVIPIFAWGAKIHLAMGLALAAGNLVGALLGVRLTVLKGQAWVKRVVTVVVIVFAIRLLWPA